MAAHMKNLDATHGSASRSSGLVPPLEVSVVIPCLNEAKSIGLCVDKALRALAESSLRGEVVVADNGSTDGSVEVAESRGARVVHVQERGYGAALNAGIASSTGAFIVMGDADDSYDFADVPRFVEAAKKGYEMVMGNRFRGGIKPGAMPALHRYFGNPGLTAVLNLFFCVGIGGSYCGMRGFTPVLYDRLDVPIPGMEFPSEIVLQTGQN